MAQQIQSRDVKPNTVSPTDCKNTRQQKYGTEYLRAGALQFEGNWNKRGIYAELLESSTFKVSGECQLKAGEGPYVGHFVVGLAKHHSMGKVKTEKSPSEEETEKDLTNYGFGMIAPIAMSLCDGDYVKFSLTSAEPYWKLQKGLLIYGVTFTPLKKN